MIKLENFEVVGWEHAIRGMRNPMNSWRNTDSEMGCEICTGSHEFCRECDYAVDLHGVNACGHPWNSPEFVLGPNDHDLMMKLRNAGTDHRKYMRMITVYVDITAPLYWWKEFDTYKVGTVANSCSTMHKIHEKEFTEDDFSLEHLGFLPWDDGEFNFKASIYETIGDLNIARELYNKTKDKRYFNVMIQLLPSSYNQRRTVMLNYEVLANMYKSRKTHKLDEWREFCTWIESLPYSEIITGYNKPDFTNHDGSHDYD